MYSRHSSLQILLLGILVAPAAGYADSWSCSKGNDVREVHVERTTSNPVPCNVTYRKLTEGVEDQVLWNAQHDAGYCDAKAREFILKLESYGWVCAETIRDESNVTEGDDNTEGEGTEDSATGEDSDKGENAAGS